VKRTAIIRRTPLKRGVCRIKPRSEKRTKDEARYKQAKTEYQLEHPKCEMPGCSRSLLRGDLIDLHHKAGRNGPLLYCKKYFSSQCRQHHDYIENNLSWSRSNGWIIDLTTDQVRQIRAEEG